MASQRGASTLAGAVQQLLNALGGADAIYEVDLVALVRRLEDVPDAASAVLQHLDGRRNLSSVLERLSGEKDKALRFLEALARIGVVRCVGEVGRREHAPAAPVAKSAAPSRDIDTWGDNPDLVQLPSFDG